MITDLEKKKCKRYVLEHIEEFCDTWSMNEITDILFWDFDFWSDFEITYWWNTDSYNFERNVLPKLTT